MVPSSHPTHRQRHLHNIFLFKNKTKIKLTVWCFTHYGWTFFILAAKDGRRNKQCAKSRADVRALLSCRLRASATALNLFSRLNSIFNCEKELIITSSASLKLRFHRRNTVIADNNTGRIQNQGKGKGKCIYRRPLKLNLGSYCIRNVLSCRTTRPLPI